MRYLQYLPGAILVLFAAALYLAIWLVQAEKNRAAAEHLATTSDIEARRTVVVESFVLNPDAEQYARRMKVLDDDQARAERQLHAAEDAAEMRQSFAFGASPVLFVIFVAVTVYTSRKTARA